MKILHCLNHFLPHHIAGTEVYVLALMQSLREIGIHSNVVIPNYGKEVNDSYNIEGFRVLKYAEPSVIDRALQMGRRKPAGLKSFEKTILQESPDIIHFHELAGSNGFGLAHVKLAKENDFTTVITFHLAGYTCKTGTLLYKQSIPCDGLIREKQCSACWYNHKGIKGWKASLLVNASSFLKAMNADISLVSSPITTALSFPFIIKQMRKDFEGLVQHCDALVAISNWYMEVLKKNTLEHHKLNFISQALPGKVQQKIISPPVQPNKLKLVFIGRISHFKGIIDLLTAIKLLPPRALALDIYGDTDGTGYMEECKSISSSMPNVIWKGRLAMGNVIQTLSCYDVLCLPSVICEMAPLVIQEAFASGIPVLASNVYGNAEQIGDGQNGWLYKFKDVDDLKEKIKMLIDNPLMIEKAKKKLPSVRDFSAVAHEYAELYNRIIIPSEKLNN